MGKKMADYWNIFIRGYTFLFRILIYKIGIFQLSYLVHRKTNN